jgi:ABC-2 type transport system ATP-binding protein
VLLLDEPTVGLDPPGARELRLLLRGLADDGVTVLLSSHDMDEVADICSSVTIMKAGSVVWDGALERLRAEAPSPEHRLETSDDARALARAAGETGVELRHTEGGLLLTAEREELDRFVLALAADGIAVRRLEEVVSSVESMFLSLVGEPPR